MTSNIIVPNVTQQVISGGVIGPEGPPGPGMAIGVYTLEQFGAVGDGTTDDTQAYRDACDVLVLAGGGAIQLGAGRTYLINRTGDGDARLPANSSIVGYGYTSTISTTVDHPVIDIGGEDCFLRDFQILGSYSGTSQHGVYNGRDGVTGSGFSYFRASGITCKRLGGRGFSMQYSSDTFIGPILNDCVADHCFGVGFFNYSSDYNQYSNCRAYVCGIGVDVGTGNMHFTGGEITACSTGAVVRLVGNDSHGTLTGTAINHCGTPVRCEAIVNGHQFVGCTIFDGAIVLVGSKAVRFIGCIIDATSYTFDGSQGTHFCGGCSFPSERANAITSTNDARTIWEPDCRTRAGDFPSFIVPDFTNWIFPIPGILQLLNTDPDVPPDQPTGGAILFGQDDSIEGLGASTGTQKTVAPK